LQSDLNHSSGIISGDRPLDTFPHILRLISATLLSYDEKNYLLSDWHPETLFTHFCTNENGAKFALRGDIKRILMWLSDKIDVSPDDNFSSNIPLLVAPLSSWGTYELEKADNDPITEKESASNLMAAVKTGPSRTSTTFDKDEEKLKRLHAVLEEGSTSMPEILSSMHMNEIRVLMAILRVVIEPPKYGMLDPQGQLTLTIYSIHKELKMTKEEQSKEGNPNSSISITMPSIHTKRLTSSMESKRPKLHPQNASAGCLAALLSDYQELLVDTIRQPGQKLDWLTVRNLRVPFWLRSDDKLRQLSEEVGQKMYRQSKDILKAAIFFIVAGKRRTLTNLAAADTSNTGRKFHKFLTTFDFSSERGRVATEKNAFSLLRKNQYDSASAFFLLAIPPMLKFSG